MNMEVNGPKIMFEIDIFGGLRVTETTVNFWLIIIATFILCKILTHKMEKIPRKKTQIIAEKIVQTIDGMVAETMGERCLSFAPYIMALFASSIFGTLITLLGMRSTTADINTTAGWAVMTFLMIHYNGIKSKGIGYFKKYGEPMKFMVPLNIVSDVTLPFSLALRHFGNVIGGTILMSIIYSALAGLTLLVFNITIPILQVGIPAFLSLYFDLFSGAIQAFIFCMLTMVFVSDAVEG